MLASLNLPWTGTFRTLNTSYIVNTKAKLTAETIRISMVFGCRLYPSRSVVVGLVLVMSTNTFNCPILETTPLLRKITLMADHVTNAGTNAVVDSTGCISVWSSYCLSCKFL